MKIGIVVHGRFFAFDLARELVRIGADITLLTNYPALVVERFGVPRNCVVSCVQHGVAVRLAQRAGIAKYLESRLHRWFSRWAARKFRSRPVDALLIFSGVAQELMSELSQKSAVKGVVRASAHIVTQARLLEEEEQRCGVAVERPSRWMIARELREYDGADFILVLSSFARDTFLNQGISGEKIQLLLGGADLARFRPDGAAVSARAKRILAGDVLHVLTVGTFSYQKGAYDLAEVALGSKPCLRFKFVGDYPSETQTLRRKVARRIQFAPRVSQFSLPDEYRQADLFLFPTIQDGYAVVLSQALASGLPALTTTNCSGPDLITNGLNGWVLPIRSAPAFLERLHWCAENRAALVKMVWQTYERGAPRDWSAMAQDLIQILERQICSKRAARKENNG